MAINLASKFATKVSERLHDESVVGLLTNKNYEWTGVDTIKIYSFNTIDFVDYTRSGDERYGPTQEIGDTLQTWQVQQDRGVSGSIDALNAGQRMNLLTPGKWAAMQTREELVPEVNAYVIQVIVTAGETANRDDIVADAATTTSNAYENFLSLNGDITNNFGAKTGRVAIGTTDYYNDLMAGNFVLDSDVAMNDRKKGVLGLVDGVKFRVAATTDFPANTDLVITHPDVTTFADVLSDLVIHKNPPGINGMKIEMRETYDAFVDTNTVDMIAIHKTA